MSPIVAAVVVALCAISVHTKPLEAEPQSPSYPADLMKDPRFAAALGAFVQQYKAQASTSLPSAPQNDITDPSTLPVSSSTLSPESTIKELEGLLKQSQTSTSFPTTIPLQITQHSGSDTQQIGASIAQPQTSTEQTGSTNNTTITNQDQPIINARGSLPSGTIQAPITFTNPQYPNGNPNQNQSPSQITIIKDISQPSTPINLQNQNLESNPNQNQIPIRNEPIIVVSQPSPPINPQSLYPVSNSNQYQVPSQTISNNALSQPTKPIRMQNQYADSNPNQNQFTNTNSPNNVVPQSSSPINTQLQNTIPKSNQYQVPTPLINSVSQPTITPQNQYPGSNPNQHVIQNLPINEPHTISPLNSAIQYPVSYSNQYEVPSQTSLNNVMPQLTPSVPPQNQYPATNPNQNQFLIQNLPNDVPDTTSPINSQIQFPISSSDQYQVPSRTSLNNVVLQPKSMSLQNQHLSADVNQNQFPIQNKANTAAQQSPSPIIPQNQYPGLNFDQNRFPSQNPQNNAVQQTSTSVNPQSQYPNSDSNLYRDSSQTPSNNAVAQLTKPITLQNQYPGFNQNQLAGNYNVPQQTLPINTQTISPYSPLNTQNQYISPNPPSISQNPSQTITNNSEKSGQWNGESQSIPSMVLLNQNPNFIQSPFSQVPQIWPSQTISSNGQRPSIFQPTNVPIISQNQYSGSNIIPSQLPSQVFSNNAEIPHYSQINPQIQNQWPSQAIANKNQWPPTFELTRPNSFPGSNQAPVASDPQVRIVFAPTVARSNIEPLSPEAQKKQAESAKYQFSTLVDDNIKGSFLERSEVRDGLRVAGKYGYDDGHVHRTVYYIADDKGFRIVKDEVSPSSKTGSLDGTARIQNYWDGNSVEYNITRKDIASDASKP